MVGRAGLILLVMEGKINYRFKTSSILLTELSTSIVYEYIEARHPPASPLDSVASHFVYTNTPVCTILIANTDYASGGLGVDVEHFKKTWGLTTTIALTGTVLPCAFGWLLMLGFQRGSLEGFAAGTVSINHFYKF